MTRIVFAAVVALSGTAIAFSQSDPAAKTRAEAAFMANLVGKEFVTKTTFPAWKDGIDVKADGTWDRKWATRVIKDRGVGLETGDRTSVTAVKVKDKHIEIHLDGGGLGTTMDVLMTSEAKQALRETSGGKLPGGSRINLRLGRPITIEDLSDLSRIADYLDPVVDASALRQAANRDAIPEEFRAAAERGDVVPGMTKSMVFGVMGEPKSKSVDTSSDLPIEKWIFELKDLRTRVVTFREGKVLKVDEF